MAIYVTLTSDKRKWTAFWLCLLLGIFGAHRFYVRKNITGFLYLLTCGGFFFGVFFDLFAILFGNFTDKDGMRLKH